MRLPVVVLLSFIVFFPVYWLLHPVVGPNWGVGIAACVAILGIPFFLLRIWRPKPDVPIEATLKNQESGDLERTSYGANTDEKSDRFLDKDPQLPIRVETTQFWFKSRMFEIEAGEDEETNPFCYGKQLAEWIRAQFTLLGYTPEEVIAEDWGRCVMLAREPFMLWIGCGSALGDSYDGDTPDGETTVTPDGSQVEWMCLVGTDIPIWTSFFWKRIVGKADISHQVKLVAEQLEQVLRSESAIALTEPK